jgi:hypothetical protein
LNEEVTKGVAEREENKNCFKLSYKDIHSKALPKNLELFLPTFYLMDDYSRCEKAAFLPTHFSSRFAFWFNIYIALFILFVFIIIHFLVNRFCSVENIFGLIVLIISIHLSYDLAMRHMKGFYDTILKCYFMTKVKNCKRTNS